MKITLKIILLVLFSAAAPLMLVVPVALSHMRALVQQAVDESSETIIANERVKLLQLVDEKAFGLQQFLNHYQADVVALRETAGLVARNYPALSTGYLMNLYPDRDTAGLPACGYVHPEYGAFANWDRRETEGNIWLNRPTINRVREDPAFRDEVSATIRKVLSIAAEFQGIAAKHKETLNLVWIASASGVAYSHPDDHLASLKEDPTLADLIEANEPYFRCVLPENDPDGRVRWLRPYRDRFKRMWMTSCVIPVYEKDKFWAAVGMDILLSTIIQKVLDTAVGRDGYVFLMDANGLPLAVPEAGISDLARDPVLASALHEILKPAEEQQWPAPLANAMETPLSSGQDPQVATSLNAMVRQEHGVRMLKFGGKDKLLAFSPVESSGWSVGIVLPLREVLESAELAGSRMESGAQSTAYSFLALIIVVILLGLGVGLGMGYRFTRPIRKITDDISRIAEGDLSRTVSVSTRDELYTLAQSVNTMVRRILDKEGQYRNLFENMTDACALLEAGKDETLNGEKRYRFLAANPSFERLVNCEEGSLAGRSLGEVLPGLRSAWGEMLAFVVDEEGAHHFDCDLQEIDRVCHATMFCPAEGQVALILSDISERKRAEHERLEMERRVQHAQKLESLGLLAGGIAHDFNNLLQAVRGNLDLARRKLSSPESLRHLIGEADKAARRAADLTRQMLAYSGRGTFIVKPLDLSALVDEISGLLRASISKSVELETNLDRNLPLINADGAQIQQIILNLIVNASEAIGERDGHIMVATGTCGYNSTDLFLSRQATKPGGGHFVYLTVTDSGCGMDDETLNKLFEPFFSTKFTGRGLGMAAVLGIVQGHKGAVFVDSLFGHGTTITVAFPIPREALLLVPDIDVQREVEPEVQAGPAQFNPVGRKTILVVDDEEIVRDTAQRMLEFLGHDVLLANDGVEALRAFRKHKGVIDCVLLDITMPHKGGLAALQELHEIQSGLPVILASGFEEEERVRHFTDKGWATFMQKPFEFEMLKARLDAIFARQARPEA